MTTMKLFIIAIVTFICAWMIDSDLAAPETSKPYADSTSYSNTDTPYPFEVTRNGQMIRFEVKGRLPLNSWKSIDIEIFDNEGNYLFAYTDELWAESGRDSDGSWTEYHTQVHLDQRFPKKGRYQAFITDSSSSKQASQQSSFRFRILAIRGDTGKMNIILWLSGLVAGFCLLVFIHRHEQEKNAIEYKPVKRLTTQQLDAMKTAPMKVWPVLLLFFIPTLLTSVWAYSDDDDEINWLSYSYRHSHIYVDRELREHSVASAQFRTGGSRGGK